MILFSFSFYLFDPIIPHVLHVQRKAKEMKKEVIDWVGDFARLLNTTVENDLIIRRDVSQNRSNNETLKFENYFN